LLKVQGILCLAVGDDAVAIEDDGAELGAVTRYLLSKGRTISRRISGVW
jgi:hypothetical protein